MVPAVSPGETTASSSQIEGELAAIWCRVLRREAIGLHEDFFAAGGHSLLALQLVHEVKRHFGRSVSLARLLTDPTIAGLAAVLGNGHASAVPDTASWKGTGRGTPFFYVPGMNGVEFLPEAVGRGLSPDRRWFDGLQHPGVDGDHPPATSLAAIASDLVGQIRAVQPRGPYALGGFCHGGLVAFEVARQLEEAGEIVRGLVLWDTFPYHCWRWRSPGRVAAVLRRRLFGPGARTFVADRLRFMRHRLALGAQVLWRRVRILLPGARGRIEARMLIAGMRARRHYTPAALRAPVLLLRSRDQRVLVEKRPQDGWASAMLGPREVVDLPHWHFDLLREPAISELASRTAAFLRQQDER